MTVKKLKTTRKGITTDKIPLTIYAGSVVHFVNIRGCYHVKIFTNWIGEIHKHGAYDMHGNRP